MWVLSMTVVTATKVDVSGVCLGHVPHASLDPPCSSEGGTEPSVASIHRRTISLRRQGLSRKHCCTRWPRHVPSVISLLIFRHTLPSIPTPWHSLPLLCIHTHIKLSPDQNGMGTTHVRGAPYLSRLPLLLGQDPFNDWGGRGCNKFISVLGGNGTKITPTGDIFDQPPGQML